MSELLECGIYVIINKKINVVYVGQTQKNFLIRWLEHLRRIEKYENDLHRLQLYLDGNTKYLIAKKIERKNDLLDFYEFEKEAIFFIWPEGRSSGSVNGKCLTGAIAEGI